GALAAALGEVVRRHASLRTRFVAAGDGEPVQVVDPPAPFTLPAVDLSGLGTGAEAEARRWIEGDARRPLDLAPGPFFRPLLLMLAEREHVFLGSMHHIVSDGWSMGVLVREVGALYAAFAAGRPSPLAPLPIQYADFAAWQRGWLQGQALEAELAH